MKKHTLDNNEKSIIQGMEVHPFFIISRLLYVN